MVLDGKLDVKCGIIVRDVGRRVVRGVDRGNWVGEGMMGDGVVRDVG